MTDASTSQASSPLRGLDRPVRVALLNDYDLVVDGLAGMLAPFEDIEVVQKAVGEMELDEPVDVALFEHLLAPSVPWDDLRALVASEGARHVPCSPSPSVRSSCAGPSVKASRRASGRAWPTAGARRHARRIAKGEQVVSSPGSHGRVPPDGYRWPLAELRLTPRESEVLALLAEGMTNRAIAEAMGLGRETVKSHVREVFLKLGVHTRSEATNRVLAGPGLLPPAAPPRVPALRGRSGHERGDLRPDDRAERAEDAALDLSGGNGTRRGRGAASRQPGLGRRGAGPRLASVRGVPPSSCSTTPPARPPRRPWPR